MLRGKINDKVLVLGIDGMDPRFTNRVLKKGLMPNLQKLLDRGAAREDLMLLGGHPTGTPPMWTTLATGCYSYAHGITCFNVDSPLGLDYFGYAFDSRKCEAEQLWNVTAEAGKKTLVFNWPGSSWPPSSDSPNLHVVDGTQPGGPNQGVGVINPEFFIIASTEYDEVSFKDMGDNEGVAPCAITDLEAEEPAEDGSPFPSMSSPDKKGVMLTPDQGTDGFIKNSDWRESRSPINEPKSWGHDLPEGAREFTVLLSGGALRRPCLLLKGESGIYDTIEFYKSKKDAEPLFVMHVGEYVPCILDEAMQGIKSFRVNRSFRALEIAEDGTYVRAFASDAMNIDEDEFFHPKSLYKQVIENVGYIPPAPMAAAISAKVVHDCMLTEWDEQCAWQSKAMQMLIEQNGYEVVFSHIHNVDAQGHMLMRHMKKRDFSLIEPEEAVEAIENVYVQTDNYIGTFLHYIDEGWNLILVSDHALVCPEYERPALGDPVGINVQIMRDLGFTYVLQDEDGNDIREVDWTKTTAVASRANQVYVNLKGRDKHTLPDGTVIDGIVDPADKWELEEDIITALYGLKHPESGHRIIEMAIRNKDAYLLGFGGEHCGDIVYWTADGYNDDHFDGLSTCIGLEDTSLSPIFAAAGPGIKQGFKTDRVIREIDVTPTVATILGVRMPDKCEGAPAYQIFEEEF